MRRSANHQSKTRIKKMATPNKKADFFERVNLHFNALRFFPSTRQRRTQRLLQRMC